MRCNTICSRNSWTVDACSRSPGTGAAEPAAAATGGGDEAATTNDAAATKEFLTSLMEYGDDATKAVIRALFQDADNGDWVDLASMNDEQQAFLDQYD